MRKVGRLVAACVSVYLAAAAHPVSAKNKCRLAEGKSQEQVARGLCGFSSERRAYNGSGPDQARCLTRSVAKGADIGGPTMPDALASLAGTPTGIAASKLTAYAGTLNATAAQLGGGFERPIVADYFIIHDTSTPNCSEGVSASCRVKGELPSDRDTSAWRDNATFQGHPKAAPDRLAHAFTNRIGGSITEVDFAIAFPTTKFEQCFGARSKVGLFVGIENIQPRIGSPAISPPGVEINDLVAPDPGFTPSQYERLALLYVAASVRREKWLIPAFHAVIDWGFWDGHDDPQNFDMQSFAAAVEKHRRALAAL